MVNKIKVSEVDDLMSLLDNDRNTSENIDISKFNVNSSKEINWKCKNGHSYRNTSLWAGISLG